jgi:hypothetical protein
MRRVVLHLMTVIPLVVGVVLVAVYCTAVIAQGPEGFPRPALQFWLGKDGPGLFTFFGPSLDTCKSFAKAWRTLQLAYAGEVAIFVALGFIWSDWRDRRRAKKKADAATAAEDLSH